MKKSLLFVYLVFNLLACKEKGLDPDLGEPSAVNLLFPAENSLCNVGTDSTTTESTVAFEWTPGDNADGYQLVVKNLNTGDSIAEITSDTKLSLRIKRACPFAWYVISKSNSYEKTAQSDIWKFYNAGEATENYAPFPAEILSPKMAETLSATDHVISLSWKANDIDGDIDAYDVYFGTTNPPVMMVSNVHETSLNDVIVTANTVYYWKVVTKDTSGNRSDSGVYQFKIR
jgi:hypothetical protein